MTKFTALSDDEKTILLEKFLYEMYGPDLESLGEDIIDCMILELFDDWLIKQGFEL